MIDDPVRPVEGITGEAGTGGFRQDFWTRGCWWISSFGDTVWIVDIRDSEALRHHLSTLGPVSVGDQGWIEQFRRSTYSDYDVYFRIGSKFVMAAIWTTRTDAEEAVQFANAVAAVARNHAPPPCC